MSIDIDNAILVVDDNSDGVACIPVWDFAETVTPWFPEAPEEVIKTIRDLEQALSAGDAIFHDLAQYLGLTLDFGPVSATLRINQESGADIVDVIEVESPRGRMTWEITVTPQEDGEPYDQALRDAGFHCFTWENAS